MIFQSVKFQKAVRLASSYYQDKKDGSSFLILDHCFRVAFNLNHWLSNSSLSKDEKEDIVIAGLFHDLLEDTAVKEKEILFFGKRVLDYTRQMTISFDQGIKKGVKPLYSIAEEVFLIKLADIEDNVSKSFFVVRNNKIIWYQDFFLPLLREYKKLIRYRVPKLKNQRLKRIITNHSQVVIDKINHLENYFKLFTRYF